MPSSDPQSGQPSIVGGCYRIEAELGHGGTARVYRVVDERSGERLALKQLVAQEPPSPTLQAMFEREYHTLVQLAHPRIVRVFDYGHDPRSPYYTMELLDGADARDTLRKGALGVGQVCALLRDAASALALIHSRRMVHRDISPRNLWCVPDGRAKLIDFGTLVAMGPQSRIAGTPPFVPPEAVYAQTLDARCDLYALGALAYYLLTGRNAYPAREIADLRQLWQRRPKRPDVIKPELPAALADLVMALLSLDPRARPASAAEVFDRLTAIGELSVEDERHAAQSFLTSPKLVGRDDASAFLRKRLLRTIRGRGNSVALVGAAGLGRSRMLASFVLEAKLMGSAAVVADASAVGSGPFALAGTIAERLLELLPLAAAHAVELAPVLGHVSPALHRALGEPKLAELTPLERTHRLSAALVQFVEASQRDQSLVIAVDDVHRSDSGSLGVLARLALRARERRLLLVTSCDAATLAQPPPALEQLVQPPNRIDLEPLAEEHTRELLGSLFGEVPGLDEAASWLHELSHGSPQTCMQYAQFLVDHEVARYQGGTWHLAPNLREQGLPPTLGAMLERRLMELSEDARSLALGLALARDESRAVWQPENHVRIEDFPRLLPDGDAARAFSALDELLHAGLVQQRDSYYVLGQRAMVDALLRVSDAQTRRAQHVRLADVFGQATYQGQGRMLVVRQLQYAGEHERARARLVDFTDRLSSATMDWGAMRVSVSAQCSLNALAHFERHGGSAREGIILRRLLLMTCSVYDWSCARFGDAQIAQLRGDIGLVHWQQTDAAVPALQRTVECLKLAQQEFDQKPEAERGLSPLDAVRELATSAMSLSGAYTNSHDVVHARALPLVLEPLRALSPLLEQVADGCVHAVTRVTGRELGDSLLGMAERLFASTGLPDVLRLGGAAIFLHTQAIEDARRGRPRDLIGPLVPAVGEDMFLVVHARWLGHAFGGRTEAQRFRKQVEASTEDDVWRRKAFLFAEAQLHALAGDLISLQRVSEQIRELAETFDGWRAWLAWTRAALHRLRGELDAADEQLRTALALAQPGEHRAWVLAAPDHAELRLLQGDCEGALRAAASIVQSVESMSLDLSAKIAAERVRALAESRLGDHESAAVSLVRAFALARELGFGGLPLAQLYEARARIALAAGDASDCLNALSELRGLLEHADAPALIGAYETLREESTRRLALPELPAVASPGDTDTTASSTMFTDVRTRLIAITERDQRARQALELLLEESGAPSGHLFLFDEHGLFPAAAVETSPASEQLLSLAQRYLEAEVGGSATAVVTVADLASSRSTPPTVLHEGTARLAPVLLAGDASGRAVVTGLALLELREATLRTPRVDLVRAISRCLHSTGDSLPMTLDE